jgi:hypothetical protein
MRLEGAPDIRSKRRRVVEFTPHFDDIDARHQQTADVVEATALLAVHHMVGTQSDDFVDIVRRRHAGTCRIRRRRRPIFAVECTYSLTSSISGCAMTARNAQGPIVPVARWATH